MTTDGSLRFRGGCAALKRAGFAIACCSSCHEDTDYGYDLCEMPLPNGTYLAVCCWVASELGDMPGAEVLAALDAAEAPVD